MSKVFTITEGLENMGALRTGGQGSVYKGRRMGPIISAVKILPTPIFTEDKSDKNLKAFENEVTKLKKVNEVPNPNVVKILNFGLTESGSFPFIEMEYIDGPDLEELLKPPHEKIFTINETIKVAGQLANALSHCHKLGVKHGDVKSNNVKYNIHSGNYVLLDFGMAIMSDEQRRTSMRHAGAIEFMAPEQNTGAMLFQTDIYSYGVILYELLAGQVPFPLADNGETSRNTVMIAHMESAVPDLKALRRKNLPDAWSVTTKEQEMQVPAQMLQVIYKCLEKDPQKRFANGEQLQAALLQHQPESDSITIQTAAPGNNISLPRRVFFGGLAIFLLAVTFALVGLFHKKVKYITVTPYQPFWVTRPKYGSKVVQYSKFNTDTILNESLTARDSAKLANYERALIRSHKKYAKPKRKKFLGLF
ncbi:serine/threonine-protein kinase [Mucilaginibacter sp.]|uniref:serine/threonine protein kinase n=1 Tax=Mucilaginibacter sp. TaxID=1882438 RepID=UPI0026204FC8|nr:serine/threonine-protein kinase [Mucilaginibacter sp.]MDB5031227.1 prkC 3 [Mucilaginibacter sp.]